MFGGGDYLWRIEPGGWYGWPDLAGGEPFFDDDVRPLLASHPAPPPRPAATFGVHSSADGFDFSRSAAFGYVGEAFVALLGDMAPPVGKVLAPVGFKVVRVDVRSGIVEDFAVNKGETNGPASWIGSGGLERDDEISDRELDDLMDYLSALREREGTRPSPASPAADNPARLTCLVACHYDRSLVPAPASTTLGAGSPSAVRPGGRAV